MVEKKEAALPEGVIDAHKWRRWLGIAKLASILGKYLDATRPEGKQVEEQQRPNPECLCGCGESPTGKGRLFCQGHSILMVELAKRYVRAELQPDKEQMRYLETSGKLDAARARVRVEDSSGRRRESQALRPAKPRPGSTGRVTRGGV